MRGPVATHIQVGNNLLAQGRAVRRADLARGRRHDAGAAKGVAAVGNHGVGEDVAALHADEVGRRVLEKDDGLRGQGRNLGWAQAAGQQRRRFCAHTHTHTHLGGRLLHGLAGVGQEGDGRRVGHVAAVLPAMGLHRRHLAAQRRLQRVERVHGARLGRAAWSGERERHEEAT